MGLVEAILLLIVIALVTLVLPIPGWLLVVLVLLVLLAVLLPRYRGR